MKRFISLLLTVALCLSLSSFAYADDYFTNRFGVSMSKTEYDELISQGLNEEDIDYLDFSTFNTYMSEAGGELISRTDSYYISKGNGQKIEISKIEAESLANNLELGIMPAEDFGNGYDSANDGICHLSLSTYGIGNGAHRDIATVTWLTNPSTNSQDILNISHNTVLIIDPSYTQAKMWYDWSVDGLNYTTQTENADSVVVDASGTSVTCSFSRVTHNPVLPVPCKNFRYEVVTRTEKNNNYMQYALVQANFYRGTYEFNFDIDLDLVSIIAVCATGSFALASIPTILSIVTSFEDSFADVLQANIIYTANII